jgi:hypothetical protein
MFDRSATTGGRHKEGARARNRSSNVARGAGEQAAVLSVVAKIAEAIDAEIGGST